MGKVGTFYSSLVHFTAVCNILWQFDTLLCFGMLCREKSGNPGCTERCM
jgi:hypothetical protein